MIKRVVKEVVFGIVEGFAMYLVFMVGVPWVISTVLRVPIEDKYAVSPLLTYFIMGVFVALGVLSSLVKPPIGVIFEVASSLTALAILFRFLGPGVLRESIEYAGTIVSAEFDVRVLLVLFVGFTLINCVVRMFEKLFAMEE